MELNYKRIMLKISGEALAAGKGTGIDEGILSDISDRVKKVWEMGIQIGIVVGGGNFWRGRSSKSMDRTTADHMGMLATVINSLALQDALEAKGVPTRVQTALGLERVLHPPTRGTSSGKESGGHFRLRNRQPVLLHGYRSSAARGGN